MLSLIKISSSICTTSPTKLAVKNSLSHAHTNCFVCTSNHNIVSFSSNPRSCNSCYQNGKSRRGYGISTFLKTRVREEVILQKGCAVDASTSTSATTSDATSTCTTGIGIVKFLEGKSFLIAGGTGYLAKVLLEKMLRTTPDVGRIFLLIRAKDKGEALMRFKSEVVESELFKCLKEIHGKSYQAFMLCKVVPVAGDMRESDLGMTFDSANEISKEVDVIVNSAANTALEERYDVSLEDNTRGPCRLLSFAKKCQKLKLFVHFSTAFANGERQGIIFEKPFSNGESITRERLVTENPSSSFPQLDVDAEIELARKSRLYFDQGNSQGQELKELALERARFFGWQNVYTLTKAMGEMAINSTRGDIPVIIVRPSIIESTYADPFPGWIQGNRVLDPLITAYGKGNLPGYLADPEVHMDVVPVDMVVNATLAAISKHGIAGKPGLSVYHVTSATFNPLRLRDIFHFTREHFLTSPFMDSDGKKVSVGEMKFFSKTDEFSAYISAELARKSGLGDANNTDEKLLKKLEMQCKKKVEHLMLISKIYEPYMFSNARFHSGNTQKLMKDMSKEEKEEFGIDFGSINWRKYFCQIHIPGVKKHVLKGREMFA